MTDKLRIRLTLGLVVFLTVALIPSATHADAPQESADNVSILEDDTALSSYLASFGVEKTLTLLQELQPQYGECHQRAHAAGRLAYRLFGEAAFSQCSLICQSGCYHGVMEELLREHGTVNLSQELETLCDAQRNSFLRHQCFHGAGHGLLAWTNYELPDALSECRPLHKSRDRESCATGVFMENVWSPVLAKDSLRHSTMYLNDDPFFPCTIVNTKDRAACYNVQPARMMQLWHNDLTRVSAACSTLPIQYQDECFEGFGREMSAAFPDDQTQIAIWCENASDDRQQAACARGALKNTYWEPQRKQAATTLCRSFQHSSSKEACYKTLFWIAPLVTPGTTRQSLCADDGKGTDPFCASLLSASTQKSVLVFILLCVCWLLAVMRLRKRKHRTVHTKPLG